MSVLKDKKVLITRPEGRALQISKILKKNGAATRHIPFIDIVSIKTETEQKKKELKLSKWVIFSSINAVDYFLEQHTLSAIKGKKIAVVGPATKSYINNLLWIFFCKNFFPNGFNYFRSWAAFTARNVADRFVA